jgi:hypothetical protein
MFLVFLWVSSIYKSCQKETLEEQAPAGMEEQATPEEDILSDLFEDDGSFESDSEDPSTENDFDNNASFEADEEEMPETVTKPKEKVPTYSSFEQEEIKPLSPQTKGGKYLVISGSYLIRSNADIMVKKLEKMGFDKAEIVQFDLSQYHSICAGRYDSQSSAQSIVNQLKSQGIDSYVHVKK